jgi:cysteine desulfuration protein SufE
MEKGLPFPVVFPPPSAYLANMAETIADLVSDFDYIDEWEDRYRHVIEIGRALPPMNVALKTPATKVSGCASQVWIHSTVVDGPKGKQLTLMGDSDALIVKGLIAVVFLMFEPLTVQEIVDYDALAQFERLGLKEHLTPQRSNGVASMIKRIKADAAAAL